MESLGFGLLVLIFAAGCVGAILPLILLTILSLFVAMPVWLVTSISLGVGVACIPAIMWWVSTR